MRALPAQDQLTYHLIQSIFNNVTFSHNLNASIKVNKWHKATSDGAVDAAAGRRSAAGSRSAAGRRSAATW